MQERIVGRVKRVNGPVLTAKGIGDAKMMELVHVSELRIVGEIVKLNGDEATIQVYEDATGIAPGDNIYGSGMSLSAELGPGLIGNIYDGIQRPLEELRTLSGDFISKGIAAPAVDHDKAWHFVPSVSVGDKVGRGSIIGTVQETERVEHRIMLAPTFPGEMTVVNMAEEGDYKVDDQIAIVSDGKGRTEIVTMIQRWPIRVPRPVADHMDLSTPLITGLRVIDTLFPLSKGGTVAIPGGFGTGKTMTQHSVAQWCDADIIVYIGCGERGNEMTDVLREFPHLIDPRTGLSLMQRTILIANTSNMPVSAREASIYTGITMAEYYRDMGYSVAIMADSTSRWAEALRELSGRMEEMPAEEGFPAYLPTRIAQFYERAGHMKTLSGNEGSVSVIGAVSPPGGDFSEPVTQNTKRFVRCFWGLDKGLAYARHFPAIHWLTSYSEYLPDLASWYADHVGSDFIDDRNQLVAILNQESSLMEIVKLIGNDVLPDDQKLTLEIARVIRLGFLQQNAFHPQDTSVPLEKQKKMMETILYLYQKAKALVAMGMPMSVLKEDPIFDRVISIKYDVENDRLDKFDDYKKAIDRFYDDVIARNA